MTDLRTSYLGIELPHPLVASAGPLSRDLDGVRRLEDAGAAAVVLASLFEEQIRQEAAAFEHLSSAGAESFAESLSYFPDVDEVGPEPYLELVRQASESVDVPIIGSLNGITSEGWAGYAAAIEQAGARAVELNVYYIPADLHTNGREVESRYLEALRTVRGAVQIPVAVKLSPFFSAFGHMARQLADMGADGLTLFNRFYQPDFDLDKLEVKPSLELSSASEIRLPLMWIAILYGRLGTSLAATTGVHGIAEVVKYLMAGADAVMTTSALLEHGPGHLTTLVDGLRGWLAEHNYQSVEQMKGSMSQQHVADPTAFERANYIRTLQSYLNPYTGC